MRINIAIITTEFLRDFINASFRSLDPAFSYDIHSYATFEELSGIYRSIPESSAAVITTGAFPSLIIERSFPDTTRIIATINNDDADIYKLALQLTARRKELTLDRIYADQIDIIGMDVPGYVAEDRAESCMDRVDAVLRGYSLERLIEMEGFFWRRHLELWRAGRIDVSITRFSSIIEQLREAGLEAHFAYPSLAHMARVCSDTLQAVNLARLKDNQIAAVIVTPARADDPREAARRHGALFKILTRFSALCPFDLAPRQTPAGCELLTNRKAIAALTEGFRRCRLRQDIGPRVSFAFSVGYGLGENIYQARLNAADAVREASLLAGGSSWLINERDEMIGPLRHGENLTVSRDVSPAVRETAKRSGLSYLTVRKLSAAMAASGNTEITARELAELLSVTPRSANRFLHALRETGLARVVDVRRGTTRGRPERVYSVAVSALS